MFSPVPISETEFTWWVYQKPSLLCLKDSVLFHASVCLSGLLIQKPWTLPIVLYSARFYLKKCKDKKQRYYKMSHYYQTQTKETMKRYIYIYIYIYVGNEGVTHNNKVEEQRKTCWKLEVAENLWWQTNKHTEPTQEILKIGGLLWLAKSVRSRH